MIFSYVITTNRSFLLTTSGKYTKKLINCTRFSGLKSFCAFMHGIFGRICARWYFLAKFSSLISDNLKWTINSRRCRKFRAVFFWLIALTCQKSFLTVLYSRIWESSREEVYWAFLHNINWKKKLWRIFKELLMPGEIKIEITISITVGNC